MYINGNLIKVVCVWIVFMCFCIVFYGIVIVISNLIKCFILILFVISRIYMFINICKIKKCGGVMWY